jgi:hypothetical protein
LAAAEARSKRRCDGNFCNPNNSSVDINQADMLELDACSAQQILFLNATETFPQSINPEAFAPMPRRYAAQQNSCSFGHLFGVGAVQNLSQRSSAGGAVFAGIPAGKCPVGSK